VSPNRPGPVPDRLIAAELTGAARRHAGWEPPDETTTAAAVAELREILAGRDDGPALLAQVAGLGVGFHEGGLGEPKAKAAAALCIAAGADVGQIERWTAEGRRRAENRRQPPFSGHT
jgi:hypothetical protein